VLVSYISRVGVHDHPLHLEDRRLYPHRLIVVFHVDISHQLSFKTSAYPPVNVYRQPGMIASKCSFTHRPISSTSALGILSSAQSYLRTISNHLNVDSRGIKFLLQPNPSINNFNLFHPPTQPPPHHILLTNSRTLISDTLIMLPQIFKGPTLVLII
jgi:hypothetical protein